MSLCTLQASKPPLAWCCRRTPQERRRSWAVTAAAEDSSSKGADDERKQRRQRHHRRTQQQLRQQAANSAPAANSSPGTQASASSSSSSSSSSSGPQSFSRLNTPWQLMGRVINEQRIVGSIQSSEHFNQGLIRSAAAIESGLALEEFEFRLERLLTLMPFLQQRLLRIQPKLLAALAADTELIACRLVELKLLLPDVDVARVAGQRPSLLLDGEWERVPAAVAQLLANYSPEDAAILASAEPLLLAEDVQEVLTELARLLPLQDPVAALQAQPSLASKVSRLSHLSLW